MIFKNNDTRLEKPYDTRICRNMIITWTTLSGFYCALRKSEDLSPSSACFLPKLFEGFFDLRAVRFLGARSHQGLSDDPTLGVHKNGGGNGLHILIAEARAEGRCAERS
jgi:hypothetical protein